MKRAGGLYKRRQYENKWRNGEWSESDLARHVEPLIDFTRAADADGFRRDAIARFGVSSRGENRVIRGGAWNNDAENCRTAYRNRNDPDNRNDNVGFRLVRLPAHQARWTPAC